MSTKRFFTVVDTRTGLTKTFDSEANTVGELKADLERLDISTNGMAIQEGLTRTELGGNDTYLPHDVPYKGGTTNNLVFRLTQAEKRIKSGSVRSDAYDQVKKLGLQKGIAAKYGKNFTMCKTAELVAEIKKNKKEPKYSNEAEKAITVLASKLVDCGVFSFAEGKEVTDIIGTSLIADEGYSVEDINDMFDGM